jgi:hypothetical protein
MIRMKKFYTIIALCVLFAACSGNGERTAQPVYENDHDAFFANLSALCGETFTGASTFPEDAPDHALVDTELNVHIVTCEEDKIKVNLYRDGDTWHATWIVEKRENGLHLYHDHIGEKEYPAGEEPLTGYGGYADDGGSATTQFFPADDYTAEILPEAATNVWMMDMNLDEGRFVYYLERHGEPRFRAEVFLN